MTVLHLVRHGESEWNLDGRVQGQSREAGGLTPEGFAQAARTAKVLAGQCPDADALFCSDLRRARQTADAVAEALGLDVTEDPRLREQDLGALQGRRFTDAYGDGTVRDVIDALWREPWRDPGGGESVTALYDRVHATLAWYADAHPGRELVLVAHGGPVRVATTSADPHRREPVPWIAVGNATVTTLRL